MPSWSISSRIAGQCNAVRKSCSITPGSAPLEHPVTLQQISIMKSRKRCTFQVDIATALKSSVVRSTEEPFEFGEVRISDLLGHVVHSSIPR